MNKNGLIAVGEQLLSRTAHALAHHPKHLTALIAALLLGGGGAAFAVASLDPEPDSLRVRQVLESVQPLPLEDQISALDLHQINLYRTELTRVNDTAETLLSRLGVFDPAAAAYLRKDAAFRVQLLGHAGRNVTVEADGSQGLQKLSARWAPEDNGTFQRLVIERTAPGRFTSRVELASLVPATRMGSATIRSSLFAAAGEARIPDSVVGQVVDILSGDIDFRHALRNGDRFNVVYEALEADGEPLRTGRVLSVEFVNKGQALSGHLVPGTRPQGRLFHAGRQEPGDLLPHLAGGVLARHQRLRDADAPDPAPVESASRDRLRRRHRHPGSDRGRGPGRIFGLAERLRQCRHGPAQRQ